MNAPGGHTIQAQRHAFLNVLMIVGSDDKQLFSCDLTSEGTRDDSPHLDEFIIHAALDATETILVCTKLSLEYLNRV
jgi:hypothetical protein